MRKTHCSGRKHKENVKDYYQKWMEEQAQSLIDKTSKANLSVTSAASPSLPLPFLQLLFPALTSTFPHLPGESLLTESGVKT